MSTKPIEQPGMPQGSNTFEAFVVSNAGDFTRYGSLSRDYRATERLWRDRFEIVFQEEVEDQRGEGRNFSGRDLENFRRDTYGYVFEGAGMRPGDFISVDTSKWIDGQSDGPQGRIHDFLTAYSNNVGPKINQINNRFTNLSGGIIDRLASDYRFLVDMQSYLATLPEGPQKDMVSAFFRDFASFERRRQDTREPSLLVSVRDVWQERTRTEFSPVVFERFWLSMKDSSAFKEITQLLRFGALTGASARDESYVVEPSDRYIMLSISRVPVEKWPSLLKETYMKFGISDPAVLVAGIRSKILELFPRTQNASYFKVVDDEDASRRRAVSGLSRSIPKPVVQAERRERKLELAVLTKDSRPNTRDTHGITFVDEEHADQIISALAEVGNTPEMQQDLAEIIRQLRNPSIANALFAQKLHVSITIAGRTLSLRRLDPRDISSLRFQDPQTAGSRITFALSNGTLYVEGVHPTHKEYERRIS